MNEEGLIARLEEYAQIDGEIQPNLRRVNPSSTERNRSFDINGTHYWYSQTEEEELTRFNNERRSLVEQLIPLQDELNTIQYNNQVSMLRNTTTTTGTIFDVVDQYIDSGRISYIDFQKAMENIGEMETEVEKEPEGEFLDNIE